MGFEELPQGFRDWKNQYACDDNSHGYNIRDLYAAYTAGLQSSTPYTEGYAKGYSDGVQAERERCARIADNEANGFRNTRIAAAIRGQKNG